MFGTSSISLVNRPTRVTKISVTIIDHVLHHTIIDSKVQSGIITDISNHLVVFALIKTSSVQSNIKKTS